MSGLPSPSIHFSSYAARLNRALVAADFSRIEALARAMLDCWKNGNTLYLCGNGGSAGNAMHLANDFVYGIGGGKVTGLRAHALSANPSVLTCLANDIDFAEVYSTQIKLFGKAGDLLIVLSGSGNSPNILRAVEAAHEVGMQTFGILGFNGGKAKAMVQVPIHFAIDDMQISEDLQMNVGHMIMQWLKQHAHEKG
jgi:D-sedoheptulose 7-phosphate isomerase